MRTEEQRARQRAADARFKAGHPERRAAQHRASRTRWAANHPEDLAAAKARYEKKNRETVRAGRRRRYAENPEKFATANEKWAAAHPDQVRAKWERRRARKYAAFVEDVDRLVLFERDNWMCGLCGEAIDPTLVWPHPQSASHDHVVPLACGGEHSYANAQAAHLVCNQRKNIRLEGVS